MKHYISKTINRKMTDAITDNIRHGNYFFDQETMQFWNSKVVYGMFSNNTFVTSEDNFDRTETLYTARQYNWNTHHVETIGEFQQFETMDEAIAFCKSYTDK